MRAFVFQHLYAVTFYPGAKLELRQTESKVATVPREKLDRFESWIRRVYRILHTVKCNNGV